MTVVVARTSLVADGGRRFIAAGALLESTDPEVKANPALFSTVEEAAAARPAFVAGTKTEDVPADVEAVDVDNADKPKTTRTRKG